MRVSLPNVLTYRRFRPSDPSNVAATLLKNVTVFLQDLKFWLRLVASGCVWPMLLNYGRATPRADLAGRGDGVKIHILGSPHGRGEE